VAGSEQLPAADRTEIERELGELHARALEAALVQT